MKLFPSQLGGTVQAPASKSILHRELICQSLCGVYPVVEDAPTDIVRTRTALAALQRGDRQIDCGESGSTLRFLLPLAAALGRVGVTFTGTQRLLQRPVPLGLPIRRTVDGWQITDVLRSGIYELDGSHTSQTTSGLLMALPLLDSPAEVRVHNAVSAGYVEMTAAVLQRYGIVLEKTADGFLVPAPQHYCLTDMAAEGDWSAAAWYLAANQLQGGGITVENLRSDSLQPDSEIEHYLRMLPTTVDISATPDIFPVMAMVAALTPKQRTVFTNGAFLREKESDRLHNTFDILQKMGAAVALNGDVLTVFGQEALQGGTEIDACGDHRMAFLTAFGALFCRRHIVLTGESCVEKSYPAFWRDYAALGGRMEA